MDFIQFSQYQSLSVTSSDVHVANGLSEALTSTIDLTGPAAAAFTVYLSPISYLAQKVSALVKVSNSTGQTATISSSTNGGTSVNIADGTSALVTCIGANVVAVSTGGGGSSTLASLTDVSIASPSNGQVLTYNTTDSKWENVIPGVLNVDKSPDTQTITLGASAGTGAGNSSVHLGVNAGYIHISTGSSPAGPGNIFCTVHYGTPFPKSAFLGQPAIILSYSGGQDSADSAPMPLLAASATDDGTNFTGFLISNVDIAFQSGVEVYISYIVTFR